MYSMYYASTMRKVLLYITALLMINVQCKSSNSIGATASSNDIPNIKRSNIQEEPFNFIDSSAVYAFKISGNDAAKQLDITPEKILQILEEEFDLSNKPLVHKILLNNITTIMDNDLPIYIFQDSLSNTNDLKTSLSPYVIIESPELCKALRLSKFNRDTKTRKKGGLRSLENESIPYHIVWSKKLVLIAQKSTHAIDEVYKKFEKHDKPTFTSHPLYESLPSEPYAGYINIQTFRKLRVFDLKNLPSTLPSEAQLYLENLLQQSLAIHHGILSGNSVQQTTTLHADFFTRSFQPCPANTTPPTTQDVRLVVNSNANGYGSLTLEREVIDALLNEIDLTEMIERLIGESKLDELKKLDPFGILQKVEDAITERIDVEVIKRFNPSGQISFGLYGNADEPPSIAILIHGSTRGMSSLQPWIEKIPSSWIPDDRGIYISTRGLVVGYGLSSDDLQRIAKSNEVTLSSTVLQYNTSLYASHELVERYQEFLPGFDALQENPLFTEILERFAEGNYTISIGCNPVSSIQITLMNTPRG